MGLIHGQAFLWHFKPFGVMSTHLLAGGPAHIPHKCRFFSGLVGKKTALFKGKAASSSGFDRLDCTSGLLNEPSR
jgi:hypothetical protein